MGFPEHVRRDAARLYKKHNFNGAEAGKELMPCWRMRSLLTLDDFASIGGSILRKQKTMKDNPRKGRPRIVPDSLAKALAKKIVGDPCASGSITLQGSCMVWEALVFTS